MASGEYILASYQRSARDTNIVTYAITRERLDQQQRWLPGEDGSILNASHITVLAQRYVISRDTNYTNISPQLMFIGLAPLPEREGFDVTNRWYWSLTFLMNPEIGTLRAFNADVEEVHILLDETIIEPRNDQLKDAEHAPPAGRVAAPRP